MANDILIVLHDTAADEIKNPEKFANTPEVCFIVNAGVNDKPVPPYLDRGWYIEFAKKRLKDFGVVV